MMSFWAISQSPLMFGGFLPGASEADVELLTNREVLDLNAYGTRSTQLWSNSSGTAWRAERLHNATNRLKAHSDQWFYCALFNVQDQPQELGTTLGSVIKGNSSDDTTNPEDRTTCTCESLWEPNHWQCSGAIRMQLPPHSSAVVRVSNCN